MIDKVNLVTATSAGTRRTKNNFSRNGTRVELYKTTNVGSGTRTEPSKKAREFLSLRYFLSSLEHL